MWLGFPEPGLNHGMGFDFNLYFLFCLRWSYFFLQGRVSNPTPTNPDQGLDRLLAVGKVTKPHKRISVLPIMGQNW